MTDHSDTPRNEETDTAKPKGVSRRSVLFGGGLAALGASFAGGYGAAKLPEIAAAGGAGGSGSARDLMSLVYPFRGKHQAGITTPAQQQMHMVAFDLLTDRKELVIQLLKDWSLAAERMMAGEPINGMSDNKDVPPDDTGEAWDLGAAGLTITFGFGSSFFETADGVDRYGIAAYQPPALKHGIPRMAAEKLNPAQQGGDLIIQACAEDPMVCLHAIHNLTRIAFGTASVRWSQLGYGRTSSTSKDQKTPRNLFGFKDGTANLKLEDSSGELDKHLWVQHGDEQGAMFAGGTYLCFRKIKMMMEVWDELVLSEQETIIGRDKVEGAPLSGGTEFDRPDFSKKDADGNPVIDRLAHVAVVNPGNNKGAKMLRRGYNFIEGTDELGRLNAGLFFIAFVRDPRTHFNPILQKMATDLLTEYLQHTASGVFLVLPGVREGEEYIGQRLMEA